MSSIIIYYSREGNNYVNGVICDLKKGNTEVAAEILRELTDADIFKIEPCVPYSKDYNECIEQAKQDLKRNARPELKSYPETLERYDTVYLGYPNYWGTMPVAMFTFLERYDFTGKTIKPFCTHEGSGMGDSESDIKKLCPNAKLVKGLAIVGGKSAECGPLLKKWL